MRKKLEVVDFLRGFSITTIVFMHLLQSYPLPSWLMKASSFGGAGAHLFILCSGFGLYLSYLNKPLKYKDFLLKRFGRIYWPMAILCLVTAFWMLYQGKEIWMPLLGNLFLFKMFVPELECSMGGHMWFISTIIQFLHCLAFNCMVNKCKTARVVSTCHQFVMGNDGIHDRMCGRAGME